jgi:hypothetical protein
MMIQSTASSRGRVVSVGTFAAHNVGHYLDEAGPAFVPGIRWDREERVLTPLQALCWRSRYVPLTGREGDMQALLEWARGGPPLRARMLVGEPGSGKTRLAAEVAEALRAEGWSAGFSRWSGSQVWQAGEAGTILILDEPFDAEGDCWDEIQRAVRSSDVGGSPLRLLVLRRYQPRAEVDMDEAVSIQRLNDLSMADAAAIHYAARRRHSPERPAPFPDQTFEEWAAGDPEVRLRPLHAIAAALSLGHPPSDAGYPSDSRGALVALARATHDALDRQGAEVGLVAGVVPLVAAVAEVREEIDESDLRQLAECTSLTRVDSDEFVARVQRLPAWIHDRLYGSGDGLPRAEFVRNELENALERGLGVRLRAAMYRANLFDLSEMDRCLWDADAGDELYRRLVGQMTLVDDRWLLDAAPRAGSLLGRLALGAAERRAPQMPVVAGDPATNYAGARQLLTLARHQWREAGATAAIDAAEGAVTLFREAVQAGTACAPELFDAFWFLGDCCRSANSPRAGDVWKAYVACARRFGDGSDLEIALQTLGESELAATADRREAWQELAATCELAGRDGHRACALESLALFVPLDEAAAFIDEAGRVRATLEPTSQPFPADHILDALFERLKATNRMTALAVARLQLRARRGRTVRDSSLVRLIVPLRIAESLEKVAEVADEKATREALREALELSRYVYESTQRRFGLTRLERVEAKLRALEGGA